MAGASSAVDLEGSPGVEGDLEGSVDFKVEASTPEEFSPAGT